MPRITPIPPGRFVRVLQRLGLTVTRTSGGHVILVKEGLRRPLVVTTSYPEVPVDHIVRNLRTAGISREEYLKALDEVS